MKPLLQFARATDALNEYLGRALSWVTLGMVLVIFLLVLGRYVFGLGSTKLQEAVLYMHSTIFLAGAGYTLLHNGHVRCDIFYSVASPRRKALIDLAGVFLFLLPTCFLIFWAGWPYVKASWTVLEGSIEGAMGIHGVYLLKTLILVFAGLVGLQGLSLAIHSALLLAGVESSRGTLDEKHKAV
jgi:TRAP-type mannitol/chloroaromatic compound transport system permease small subunit